MSMMIKKRFESKQQQGKEEINPMVKMMLKQFLPLITDKIHQIDPALKDILSSIELKEGEKYAVFMLTVNPADDVVYILSVCMNETDSVTRIVSRQKLTDFINSLLEKAIK